MAGSRYQQLRHYSPSMSYAFWSTFFSFAPRESFKRNYTCMGTEIQLTWGASNPKDPVHYLPGYLSDLEI